MFRPLVDEPQEEVEEGPEHDDDHQEVEDVLLDGGLAQGKEPEGQLARGDAELRGPLNGIDRARRI